MKFAPHNRIGGEKFLASPLPDTTRQDALSLAEQLRTAFEATTHTLDRPLSATVSVGVVISGDASSDLAALLNVADQALYRAKAMGRNRVELSMYSAALRSDQQAPCSFPSHGIERQPDLR